MRALQEKVAQALGSSVIDLRPIAGGDINESYACTLADDRRIFLKYHPQAPPSMFAREAEGLQWLQASETLRVPKVLAFASADGPPPYFLALELLSSAPKVPNFDEDLGRGLARLHQYGADGFGFKNNNFIGTLPQDNRREKSWSEFYRSRRLQPQLGMLRQRMGNLGGLERKFDRFFARLPDWVGPEEAPSRLHGDLWGGNLHTGPRGEPCLIDPAVYGGHREMDLAMMKLFGGFGPRVFDAYLEAHPCAPGLGERIKLYQLYPLLVHANLFGGHYVRSVESVVDGFV